MKEFTVNSNDARQRFDRFIGKAVPLLPESLLQKYIRLKRIKLNGKGAKRDTRLSSGDLVQMYINDEFFEKPREENSYLKVGTPKLTVVYEDENILLADKKPGVLCIITEKTGSAPRGVGSMMLVTKDGQLDTIGGGPIEHAAILDARNDPAACIRHYQLGTQEGAKLGMICGGTCNVLFLPI